MKTPRFTSRKQLAGGRSRPLQDRDIFTRPARGAAGRRSTLPHTAGAPMTRVVVSARRAGALVAAPPASRPRRSRLVAIRAGRLVDVEQGEIRRDQLIIVRGERIEAVQPGSAKVPSGRTGHRPLALHGHSRPDRLPYPPDRRCRRRRRAAAAGALRGPGGVERGAERPGHAACRLHHRAGRRHLSRLRGRGAARRHQRRHGHRPADGGGRRVCHGLDRRRRAGRSRRRT